MVHTTPLRPSPLLDLPLELVTVILVYLDPNSLLACSSVCRTLHTLTLKSYNLQYTLALHAHGLAANPFYGSSTSTSSSTSNLPTHDSSAHLPDVVSTPVLPIRDRLALIHARRRAWRTLSFTSKQVVRIGGECAAYEFVGGVFTKTGRSPPRGPAPIPMAIPGPIYIHGPGHAPIHIQPQAHGQVPLPAHVPPHQSAQDRDRGPSFIARWLPTSTHPGGATEKESLGINARDFAIDPSQNLMALVEFPDGTPPAVHIHLRTLSGDAAHPMTRQHILRHVTGGLVDSAVVQVADDALSFFWASHDAPGLVIWNWRTGAVLVSAISGGIPRHPVTLANSHITGVDYAMGTPLQDGDAWDFDFLSPRSYVLANRGRAGDGGSLAVYSFTDATPESDDTPSGSTSSPSSAQTPKLRLATCKARLYLPALQPGVRLANIAVHSGPVVARPPASEPFITEDGGAVHVISLDYVRMDEPNHYRYSLFVLNRTLRAYLDPEHSMAGGRAKGKAPMDVEEDDTKDNVNTETEEDEEEYDEGLDDDEDYTRDDDEDEDWCADEPGLCWGGGTLKQRRRAAAQERAREARLQRQRQRDALVRARTEAKAREAREARERSLARANPGMHIVSWEAWGPADTRILPQYAPFGWLRYAHGSRVVLPPMLTGDGDDPDTLLRVLEFGVRPGVWGHEDKFGAEAGEGGSHRSGARSRSSSPSSTSLSSGTEIARPEVLRSVSSPGLGRGGEDGDEAGDQDWRTISPMFEWTTEDMKAMVFARPVHTCLPFVVLERQERRKDWQYKAFMIDEQRLIGLKVGSSNPFLLGDMKDLDVYTV